MKSKFLLSSLLMLCALGSFATDFYVEPFGIAPAYDNISDAIAAASDGDRILIKNDAGQSPYVETLTINKSLQLLSMENDTFFVVQGNVIIDPSGGDIDVVINGMKNANGNITSSVDGSVQTHVHILDSYLLDGNVSIDDDHISMTMVGCKLGNGTVTFRHGKLIGSEISVDYKTTMVTVNDGTPTVSQDTVRIVGCKLVASGFSTSGTSSMYGMRLLSGDVHYQVLNNFVDIQGSVCSSCSGYGRQGIVISAAFNDATVVNQVYNNSVRLAGHNSTVGISTVNSRNFELMNNVIDNVSSSGATGISAGSGTIVSYNVIDNAWSNEISGSPSSQSNNSEIAVSVVGDGTSTASVDMSNPDPIFYDLDLTRGDADCYGGSNTFDNYYPLFQGSARVFSVSVNQKVRKGSTLSLKAEAFDR